jgi:hypothetical protein
MDDQEWIEEQTPNGVHMVPATRWRATQNVVMDLTEPADFTYPPNAPAQVSTPTVGAPGRIKVAPKIIRVPEGTEILLPSSMDHAIHQTVCHVCTGSQKLYCRDSTHTERDIVGGMGVGLVRVSGAQARLHPALDPTTPRPAPTTPTEAALDQRMLARAAAAKAGGQ